MHNWKTIRSVLGNSIDGAESANFKSIAWLDFQWKLIVGGDLVSVTRVDKLSSKSLFVTVSDKVWFAALDPFREKIISKINKRAGSILVDRIIFQEGTIVETPMKGSSGFSGQICRERKTTEIKKHKVNKLCSYNLISSKPC